MGPAPRRDNAPDEATFEGIVDPANGTVFPLWPGETKRIAFTAPNPFDHMVTFEAKVEGADRFHQIDAGVHHVPKGGTARIEITLHVPADALPEERAFRVQLLAGVRDQNRQMAGDRAGAAPDLHLVGGTAPNGLTIVRSWNLGLRISINPILKLSAPDGLTASAGPRSPLVNWALKVESVKNTEMDWRIAVKTGEQKPPGHTDVIFKRGVWDYVFDHEMNRFERFGAKDPPPQIIQLQARRRGRWWFGWTESHELEIEAQPVANPGNDGIGENTLTLRARRWRFLPCDGVFFAPLVLLAFMALGPAPSELAVKNAIPYQQEGLFVMETVETAAEGQKLAQGKTSKQLPLDLKWNAPWGAPLAIKRTCPNGECGGNDYSKRSLNVLSNYNGLSDSVTEDAQSYGSSYLYSLGRWLGSPYATKVTVVPARTFGMLSIHPDDKNALSLPVTTAFDKKTEHRTQTLKDDLIIPRNQSRLLWLKNSSPTKLSINFWIAQYPSSANYRIDNVIQNGQRITNSDPQDLRIWCIAPDSNEDVTGQLVLVSTDAMSQIIVINLRTPGKNSFAASAAPTPAARVAPSITGGARR